MYYQTYIKTIYHTSLHFFMFLLFLKHGNRRNIKKCKEVFLNRMDGNTTGKILLLGDLNCKDIDWDEIEVRRGAGTGSSGNGKFI